MFLVPIALAELGKTDIWRAHRSQDGHWTVENAGTALNTADDEYEPLPAPDGRALILMANDGLYRSERDARGAWRPREKLPAPINVNGSEIGALFSPVDIRCCAHAISRARSRANSSSGAFAATKRGRRPVRHRPHQEDSGRA